MPQAVTHLLFPLVIGSWIKDWYEKKKSRGIFSLRYVLVAGIGGVLPDLDLAIFWILYYFGFTMEQVHRTFTHTIFLPLIFLILFFVLNNKVKLGRLKWNTIFLMLALGSSIHLILDGTLSGYIVPLYPLLNLEVGLNLVGMLPKPLMDIAIPLLDGILLILWVVYLEWKHKVSDFI